MIVLKTRDRDHPDYHVKYSNSSAGKFPIATVFRRGQEHQLEGEPVELFTIRVMAEALDRTSETLVEWEKRKLFPKPLFLVATHRIKRWYSSIQIINLHNLMWGKYECRKNQHMDMQQFFEDVRKVFYEHRPVVDEQGRIGIRHEVQAAVARKRR